MTKFKECIKRNKYSFLSFGIVSLFLLIIYAINGIAPFGTNTIMKSDAWHQYVPLLSQLYDKLSSGGSLIYSFSIGNGINAIGNILNLYLFVNIIVLHHFLHILSRILSEKEKGHQISIPLL